MADSSPLFEGNINGKTLVRFPRLSSTVEAVEKPFKADYCCVKATLSLLNPLSSLEGALSGPLQRFFSKAEKVYPGRV